MGKSQILLESGTNELEFIEFKVDDVWYGLNVAKVKEIILRTESVPAANMHPSVEGIFDHRGNVIPLINLAKWLGKKESENIEKDKILICELNNMQFGFIVHFVSRIKRITWKDLEAPQSIIASSNSAITGVVKSENKLILMLDVEKIVDEIEPSPKLLITNVDNASGVNRRSKRVFFADDSPMIRSLAKKIFEESGYTDIEVFNNGAKLWDKLVQVKKSVQESHAEIRNFIDILVTDLEMPQIDGMHLIKKIKEDNVLNPLPIIVFSSMTSEQLKEKTKKLGATSHINKPDVKSLILEVDKLVSK